MFDVSGYDVRESLTEGGVFGVYRALRKTDGAEVALKVVRALDPDGRLAGQLRRELELSREMDPDAVARGITIELQADRPVLVREFRGATTLGARVAAGPMPLDEFCRVALAVVRALAAVHRGGVVHRDVKPSNILLDAEGERAWLTDFGIATRVDGVDAQGEHLEGTLQYMAPEQSGRTRRAVGPASDLYALGVVFYEMLTGALPFHRSTALEWVHAHLAMEPPAPRGLRPELPPALEAITLKLLSKDPDARYQSCAGLAADLERCRAALARGAAPHAFTLGTEDLPERFHRPQGLVGRTRVLASLCDAYDRVADGDGAVVRVRGEAGAGKSALVSELRRHVVAHGGRFAQGKHDLHQRGVPYAALLTALRQAVRSLLGSDAPSLARWSARLSEALRPNAGVLAAVIPELASVLGALDPVPPIGPAEADVRFQLAFHALVGALAAPGEPLCLFIDDAQWADEASLRLLRALATRCPSRVLLLTAERDPEPDPGGLREAFWKGLDEDGAPVTAVDVGPIDEDSVTTLVERVFPAPAHDAQALAAAVRARTRGNPFATVEFLGALADAGVVRFDPADRRWRWDLDEVRAARVPDTAAELVAARLSSLPTASRRTLGLAAVVGARFSADLVAAVGELGDDEVAAHLAEAMNDGLAAPLPGDDPSRAPWRFAHDRVEEAAYAALPEPERVAAHARVYHALRLRWGNDLDGERLFTLSHHLSLGRSEITVDDDRQEAASIARRAATVAREAAAYRAALDDLALVDELRGTDGWAGRHDERVELLVDRAECAYLATDFAEVERAAEAARALARNAVERARVEEVRVRAFNHRGEHARAVETALAALDTLGQRFPESPGNGSVIGALAATRLKLGRRGADALEELPELDDPTLALVLKLLVSCSASTFFVAPNLFPLIAFRVVQITAANGATGLSAFGYAAYALLLTAHFGQVDTGLRFGELARRTVDRFGAEALRPQVEFLFNYFIRHWKDPLADCAADHAVAARRGLEVGSLEYWAYNLTAADAAEFLRGAALETLLTRVRRSHEQLKALRQTKTTAFHSVFVGMIEVLMGLGDERALTAREEEVLAGYAAAGDLNGTTNIQLFRAIRRSLLGDSMGALEAAAKVEEHMAVIAGQSYLPGLRFHQALSLAEALPSMSLADRAKGHVKLRRLCSEHRTWGARAPVNYGHRSTLLDAELARVEGRGAEALERYEKAVSEARAHDAVADRGVACARAADWHRSQGRESVARSLAEEARRCFVRWGAKAMVDALDARYGAPAAPRHDTRAATLTGTTGTQRLAALDLESVLKAARAVSGEIELDELLKKLVAVVIENAGARRGVLLRVRDGALRVEAEGRADGEVALRGEDLARTADLPRSIVQYVARTGETVLLEDAAGEGPYVSDPFVRQAGVRSVLCTAISRQGEVRGVIYLEHQGSAGAFPPERVEVVRVLAAQAAVSLENATLYDDLKSALRRQISLTEANLRFVPGEFINALGHHDIDEVSLGDTVQKEMTVLFSDMRNFTRHVEGMSPVENIAFINEYLAQLEPAVIAHGGFVDSYIGDAVMALFEGSPAEAVAAGVAMQRSLAPLNERRRARGRMPITMGVGLNTGELTLGTIGGPRRIKCGVIGDAVNLAARIESLTKSYGAAVLVGEATLAKVEPGRFSVREVDRVRVVGRLAPVTMYEVLDALPDAKREAIERTLGDWREAVEAYREGRLDEALAAFGRCRAAAPDDMVTALRYRRCERYLKARPEGEWSEVEELTHK